MGKNYDGIIPKGSKVLILVGENSMGTCTTKKNLKVEENNLILLEKIGLICIKSIEPVGDLEYILHACWQSCLGMRFGVMFKNEVYDL